MRGWIPAAVAGLLVLVSPAQAAPFVPASDDEVVASLPSRLMAPSERQAQRALRLQRAAAPRDVGMAVDAARAALVRARQSGDPRDLGEAQAALAPWWAQAAPPAPVRLLRAMLLQSQHHFDLALADLAALAVDATAPPDVQAQAALTRVTVLQVTGRWDEAATACDQLARPALARLGAAVALPARVCRAELASLRGDARGGAAGLAAAALATPDEPTGRWVALVRAELGERLGDPAAQALYREALGPSPDLYTLAALADWLLAHDRAREVPPLLAGREDADALLLRLAIAWRRLGDPQAARAARTLADRFEAAALRQDITHRREQARFALDVQGDARAALPLAMANWSAQKEPADALLLVRAAAAAGQPGAAGPVWRFVQDTGLQDVRLAAAGSPP